MRTLITILLCSLLIQVNCTNIIQTDLGKDPIIQTLFSDIEIESLEKVLHYFNLEVINNQNPTDKNNSLYFENYLQKIRNDAKLSQNMYSSLKIEDEHREVLIAELKSGGLFNQFYEMDTVWFDKTRNRYSSGNLAPRTDSIAKIRIQDKFDGKYHQLIKEWAKHDSIFLDFAETYSLAGEFVGFGKMVYEFEDFDLTSDRVELFYVLSFLMIDDPLPKIER